MGGRFLLLSGVETEPRILRCRDLAHARAELDKLEFAARHHPVNGRSAEAGRRRKFINAMTDAFDRRSRSALPDWGVLKRHGPLHLFVGGSLCVTLLGSCISTNFAEFVEVPCFRALLALLLPVFRGLVINLTDELGAHVANGLGHGLEHPLINGLLQLSPTGYLVQDSVAQQRPAPACAEVRALAGDLECLVERQHAEIRPR